MAQATWTKDDFYAELDKLNEDVVRERVATGIYKREKHALAQLWLADRERDRKEASSREQMRIARSAKNAAWAAATAAIIAAICAAIAIGISLSFSQPS